MFNRSGKPKPDRNKPDRDPLERGQFSDGSRTFTVRASSADAPDSFLVHTKGNPSDVILAVSGLHTGSLYGTWNEEWRSASPEWREWLRNNAFKAFHIAPPPSAADSDDTDGPASPGKIRFCGG